jgi:rhomboid protease GluP
VQEDVEEEEEESTACRLLAVLFPGYLGVRSALGALSVRECVGFGVSVALGAMVGDSGGLCTLYHLGASWAPAMAHGGWWRLLAQIFLHANLQHLLTNIVFQCRLGFLLERELGGTRFCALYIVSGVLGNLFSAAMDPFKLSVGASGAAFAMLGASMTQLLAKWRTISPASRHGRVMFYALILPTLLVNGGMDRWSHLGGCAAGGLMYLLFSPELDHAESGRMTRMLAASMLFGWFSFDVTTLLELDWSAAPQLACGTLLHPGSVIAAA